MEGPKAALVASKDFDGGHYKTSPHHGIRAFGRVYSAWAYGQAVSARFHSMKYEKRSDDDAVVSWAQLPVKWAVSVVFNLILDWRIRYEVSLPLTHRYPDLNSWLRERWEGSYVAYWDANDMLTLLDTWQSGDISQVRDKGDLMAALMSIKAKALIMPCKTDLYFPVRAPEYEYPMMTK